MNALSDDQLEMLRSVGYARGVSNSEYSLHIAINDLFLFVRLGLVTRISSGLALTQHGHDRLHQASAPDPASLGGSDLH
jgi:hypothetical protein